MFFSNRSKRVRSVRPVLAPLEGRELLNAALPHSMGELRASAHVLEVKHQGVVEAKKVKGNDFFGTTTFPVGDKYCSLVVGGWGGTVVGLSSINFRDAVENETTTIREFKHDQWYCIRIRVTKNRIRAWIDDKKVVDLETKDKRLSIRAECDPCRPFGIATWRTTGAVRDVRVRLLAAAERSAND